MKKSCAGRTGKGKTVRCSKLLLRRVTQVSGDGQPGDSVSEVLLRACARGSAPARNRCLIPEDTVFFQGFFESRGVAIKIYSIEFSVQSNYR